MYLSGCRLSNPLIVNVVFDLTCERVPFLFLKYFPKIYWFLFDADGHALTFAVCVPAVISNIAG